MDQLPAGYSPGPPASNPRPERSSSTLTGPWSEEDARSDESPATGLLDGTSDEIANKIEDMLEGVVDALVKNQPMTIPLRSRRSGNETMVTFPALTSAGSRKFAALLQVLFLCHEALVSGTIMTKRNIYYQNPGLFGSQAYVDQLVDDVAFTLGVSRDSLNVIAASKGFIVGGPFSPGRGNHGVPVPRIRNLQGLDLRGVQWLLVIEKEATFRSLAASRYFETSGAGPGILVTAKGYPDLATRQFLSMVHSSYPYLSIYALVDFDPDGIAIMRTYKHGSRSLCHEENASIPGLAWLGVRSRDIVRLPVRQAPSQPPIQPAVHEGAAGRGQRASSSTHQLPPHPPSSPSSHVPPTMGDQSVDYKVAPLTQRDRKKAVAILNALGDEQNQDPEEVRLMPELQIMLMLNMKFEIQAIDDGAMAGWLDAQLESVFAMDP